MFPPFLDEVSECRCLTDKLAIGVGIVSDSRRVLTGALDFGHLMLTLEYGVEGREVGSYTCHDLVIDTLDLAPQFFPAQ
jgi:hypothetical protein